ncbi:MAG: SDR family oxidoreductase, partial [Actinomycetota bacterium]
MVENAAGGPPSSMVDRLNGKTILLTGVTGFLGQVIFERLLGDVPEGRIVLLVRSQTGSTSRARVEYLFRKPAFDVLRGRMGDDGLRALLDERVTIVDGDFSRGVPQLPGDIDIAIHSAATV